MMEKEIVVGMGEALWDLLPQGKMVGGAPANFAYHVGQFGQPSCVVSAVGYDELGREILEHFNRRGLDYLVEMVDYPTGTVKVALDDRGIPQYEICEDVAWDNIPFTPELEALARRTVAVCFGSLAQRSEHSRLTIRHFLDAMPQTERSLIVFDINLRQEFYTDAILSESLKRCNVLKINDEELEIVARIYGMTPGDQPTQCRELIDRFGLKILILTCGVEGSYVLTPDETSFLPTPKVDVADTVGAGDSFTAAFVASLLKGYSLRKAHEKAVETSAYVCSQNGSMPILPQNILDYGTV